MRLQIPGQLRNLTGTEIVDYSWNTLHNYANFYINNKQTFKMLEWKSSGHLKEKSAQTKLGMGEENNLMRYLSMCFE